MTSATYELATVTPQRSLRAVPPLVGHASLLRREFAGVSVQSHALAHMVRRTVKPVIDAWARSPGMPWPTGLIDRVAFPLVPVRGTVLRPVRLSHCHAEWMHAPGVSMEPGAGRERAILYLHGGAFLCCGLATHRHMVSRISAAAAAPTLSVAYRMLPKSAISTAVADGVDGYKWLLTHGYAADRIVIAGDSAGGYLAFMVTLAAMGLGLPRPAANVALSPLTDLDPTRKVQHPNAHKCAVFPRRAVPVLTELIRRVDARLAIDGLPNRPVSPVDGVLHDMPPALIQTGSEEMIYPDAELMAERLSQAGVSCELQVWERQVHVFQAAAGLIPEGRRAIERIGAFVRATV